MRNFKSFSGSVKLNFQQGFNVITGPNGSGKSNIVDAVQFVFGELGSKRMRVADLSGLIYDGLGEEGSSKPQYAQVTIYLNNSDRGLAIDRKTVSIGRRVDRKGKSKYFLNGKKTSRRALLDLLVMAGISPGGYNIVLQGTATRLSDITTSERMNALEDLVGLKEYDEKKTEAKTQLSEAERKIEVASAKGDEVRKRVNELERQKNDALRHYLLTMEERRLKAFKLSHQLTQLEYRTEALRKQITENKTQIEDLEKNKADTTIERDAARDSLEEFIREASEKGNTRLPLLKSDLVGKRTLRNSLESRLREIDSKKILIQRTIENKLAEIERSRTEIDEKQSELQELTRSEAQINVEIQGKESQLQDLSEKIRTVKESAETNQKKVEDLTESLIPSQESISGLEIEINRHLVTVNSLDEKLDELRQKKNESFNTSGSLAGKIAELEALKIDEAHKLEEILSTIEDQVKRQKNMRTTIENANKLAKDAELTITQFTAKKDLWKNVVTEEKAQARVREMGEAGAIKGYHGPLRSLVKIDLKNQRAVRMAANGWINAIIVDDIGTAIECVEGLKKNKLGMTRFLPLNNINVQEPLPEIEGSGIIGYIPRLIRYAEKYAPAVNLIWGDTFIVKDRASAVNLAQKGYRAVTTTGDVFESEGGLIGGHYRRPPNFSKLIPTDESINELSKIIQSLRSRLTKRMTDLKLSGGNLREFTSYIDHFNNNIEGIDKQIEETRENIKRLEKKITSIEEKIVQIEEKVNKELSLITTLRERKESTQQKIGQTKAEIAALKEQSKLSDVAHLEVTYDTIVREVTEMRNTRSQLISDITVLTNLIERYLQLKTSDSEDQIKRSREEIETLEHEREETLSRLEEETAELGELQKALDSVTSDVEATSRIMERYRKKVRQFDQQIERLGHRRVNIDRRSMELNVEVEKFRLQTEQRSEELVRLGFEEKIHIDGIDLDHVDSTFQRIQREKSSIGAINQLAEVQYEEYMGNYKQLSIRINELEKERGSIFNFIDEVEKEKQEHFMKAFNEVCENFSAVFAELTGGGDGRLELQKPEDPFTGGVDLYVQFPGKPMRLVSGASGGERSVAAIAYLLAIQRFLKAPFYLFDEIDAHLDDLNASRLADVLKKNALESQFLMVSLKDVMVHNADKIYGVFAQRGRSRIIALPMKMEVAV